MECIWKGTETQRQREGSRDKRRRRKGETKGTDFGKTGILKMLSKRPAPPPPDNGNKPL